MRFERAIYSGLATLGLTFCIGMPCVLASVNIVVQPTNQVALVTSNATFTATFPTAVTVGKLITATATTADNAPNGDNWMTVTTKVEDPVYFARPYLTTTDFKKLPDATGWNPTPCSAR